MRFMKTVTKGLVPSDSTASIETPNRNHRRSSKIMWEKFKNRAFKYFAARHTVNYLQQNLHKLAGVTARACAGRPHQISMHLEYFLGTNSNVLLTKGDFIIILNRMVSAYRKKIQDVLDL